MAVKLRDYAIQNAEALGFGPSRRKSIRLQGFHPAFRVSAYGQLQMDLVAQFTQFHGAGGAELGGLELRAGTTVVASADGTVRYAIAKPLLSDDLPLQYKPAAEARHDRQKLLVEQLDREDPHLAWAGRSYLKTRVAQALRPDALDRRIRR